MINPWTGEDPDRGLTPVGNTLEEVLERATEGRLASFQIIETVWRETVPETWRARSRPISFNKGILTVEVTDGGVASLLRLEQGRIKAALDERVGRGEVAQIRLKVRQGKYPPRRA